MEVPPSDESGNLERTTSQLAGCRAPHVSGLATHLNPLLSTPPPGVLGRLRSRSSSSAMRARVSGLMVSVLPCSLDPPTGASSEACCGNTWTSSAVV